MMALDTKTFFCILLALVTVMIAYRLMHKRPTCAELQLLHQYRNFNQQDKTNNLFIKYGGLDTIEKVVDDAVTNLLAEPTLQSTFSVVGQPSHRTGAALKATLDLQFSALFGAPFVYPGRTFTRGQIVDARNMRDSHKGLNITTQQFNTFVSILVNTLLQDGVSQEDVNKLAPSLQAMVKDIVTVT